MYLDDLLPLFLADHDARPSLSQPNLDGNLVVATDAHILMVAPKQYFEKQYTTQSPYPDWRNIVPQEDNPIFKVGVDLIKGILASIPLLDTYKKCQHCNGTGKCTCIECDAEHDCGKCDGSGETDTIIGKHIDGSTILKIGNAKFQLRYIESTVAVAERIGIADILFYTNRDNFGNLTKIGDVQILLMPMIGDIKCIDIPTIAINKVAA